MEQIKERIARKILKDFSAEDKFNQMMSKRKKIEEQCNKRNHKRGKKNVNRNKTFDFERSRKQESFYEVSYRERSREKPEKTVAKEHSSPIALK